MLDAFARVRSDRANIDARVLIAPSLDEATRAWTREVCRARRVPAFDVDPSAGAMPVLTAFDAAVCASGTVSLEATLARAAPVVTYRVGLATELTARALLRTSHVALPNIMLGRRAFPELLQREANSDRIAEALTNVLERRRELLVACDRVEDLLGSARTPSSSIARVLEPWLRPDTFAG
jgi:lipid-A-disaccharide synthase